MPPFAENLEFGQTGESITARWVRSRGSSVLPAYEKELDTGKGPRLFTPTEHLVTPDLFVFPAMEFIEAKHKTVFTWYRKDQKWCTGIDLHHYRQYKKTQKATGRKVWLFFLHRSAIPDEIDLQHDCCPLECPTGLYGNSLDFLANHESHRSDRWGRQGMVYWAHEVLKLHATLDDLEEFMRDEAPVLYP